jgi:glycosyltransferase involved in cell wall biosynthesis/CDP-glycerol glycerophosphotransferase (TagB/SpsB family)
MTGIERLAIDLSNEMVRRGHSVSYISNTGTYTGAAGQLSPRVHRLDVPHDYSDEVAEAIRDFVVSQRIDVVAPLVANSIVGIFPRALYGTGIPLVISEHNNPEYSVPAWWCLGPTDERKHQMRRSIFAAADRIHLLADEYRGSLPDYLQDRICVINNPTTVNPQTVSPLALRPKKLLFVGRLDEQQKRVSVLIDAFAELNETFPEWTLEIVGTGPDEQRYAQQIRELGLSSKVHLIGESPNPESHYLSSQVLCLPSKFEGLPLSVLEAKACRLPTVAFRACSGMSELVSHGVDGILVDPVSTGTYAQALAKLMSDEPYRVRLSDAALLSAERYRPAAFFDDWEALLRQTAACRGATVLDALAGLSEQDIASAELRRIVEPNAYQNYMGDVVLRETFERIRTERAALEHSASFKVTSPMRRAAELARKGKQGDLMPRVRGRIVRRTGRISARLVPTSKRPRVVFVDVEGLDHARLLFGQEYPPECFVVHGRELDLATTIAIANADVIVSTCGAVFHDLNPHARRIEIWHASGAVKRFGNRSYGRVDRDYVVCCPSETLRETYAQAFGAALGAVEATGVPQTDILFDTSQRRHRRDDFLSRHPELASKTRYVYFPTFRGQWPHATSFSPRLDPAELSDALPADEVLLVKLHPVLQHNEWLRRAAAAGDSVRDMSDEDTTTLLEVADVVIVDYSSILFDAVLLNKRIVAYAEDVDTYAFERGFAFDYRRELPCTLVERADPRELLSAIRDSKDGGSARMNQFRMQYVGACDGKATARVRGLIADFLQRGDYHVGESQ